MVLPYWLIFLIFTVHLEAIVTFSDLLLLGRLQPLLLQPQLLLQQLLKCLLLTLNRSRKQTKQMYANRQVCQEIQTYTELRKCTLHDMLSSSLLESLFLMLDKMHSIYLSETASFFLLLSSVKPTPLLGITMSSCSWEWLVSTLWSWSSSLEFHMPVGNIHQTYTDLSSQSCQQSGGSMGSLCWPLYNSTFAVILVISLFFFTSCAVLWSIHHSQQPLLLLLQTQQLLQLMGFKLFLHVLLPLSQLLGHTILDFTSWYSKTLPFSYICGCPRQGYTAHTLKMTLNVLTDLHALTLQTLFESLRS